MLDPASTGNAATNAAGRRRADRVAHRLDLIGGPCGRSPEPLTPEQRQELERQAVELDKSGFQLYQRGAIAPALEKIKQATPDPRTALSQERVSGWSRPTWPQAST